MLWPPYVRFPIFNRRAFIVIIAGLAVDPTTEITLVLEEVSCFIYCKGIECNLNTGVNDQSRFMSCSVLSLITMRVPSKL